MQGVHVLGAVHKVAWECLQGQTWQLSPATRCQYMPASPAWPPPLSCACACSHANARSQGVCSCCGLLFEVTYLPHGRTCTHHSQAGNALPWWLEWCMFCIAIRHLDKLRGSLPCSILLCRSHSLLLITRVSGQKVAVRARLSSHPVTDEGSWCRRLAELGMAACQQGTGVAPFQERWRDTHDFARRVSRLPEQREGDIVDYRGLLHRDGSVLSSLTLKVGGWVAA